MKSNRIITFLFGIFIAQQFFANNEIKISRLLELSNMNISNTINCNADSVIKWSKEVSPLLLDKKDYPAYFEIKLLQANAYCTRGDISLGIDLVQRMVNKATEINSQIGTALAGIGIGDTYTYSNMYEEAENSYKEVLESLQTQQSVPEVSKYIKFILIKLARVLILENKPEEAFGYLQKLNKLYAENKKPDPLYAFVLLYNAFYYIKSEQPDEAKQYLDEADRLLNDEPRSLRTATLHFITGNYYEKTDNYSAALEAYNRINEKIENNPDSGKFNRLDPGRFNSLMMNKAHLYLKMGLIEEATLLFQEITAIKDSLRANSYTREVNALSTIYKVNQMELDNQKERNRQNKLFIFIMAFILLLIIGFGFYIIKSNRKLYRSRLLLKQAKKEAEDSVKAKSMILSNMSHEIRTPLNAVTGFSNVLIEDSLDNETRKQCNDIIQQNSELLIKLINDVIDLSTLDFGKMVFSFREDDIVKICKNVIDTIDKIKQTDAEVLFKTTVDKLMIVTDESRLQQVLFNLLINATKFTTEGQIVLELSVQPDDTVLFTVTDTGCGIAPEKQQKIFQRFEKLNERVQGTGLGLSICQLIINEIGGKIWIDPLYTNGSRFCFTHPFNPHNS